MKSDDRVELMLWAQSFESRLAQLKRKLASTSNAPADLRHAAVDADGGISFKDEYGNVIYRVGRDSRTGVVSPEYIGGPDPETPAAPFVDVGGETVKIQHSGLDVHEEEGPADYRRTIVFASQEPDFEAGPDTYAGRFQDIDGSMTHRLPGGTWYIAVQWETLSGKLSELSEVVEVEVPPLVDEELIQEHLDERQAIIDAAMAEFELMNQQRKEEIDNLNNEVLPALEATLIDAMEDLEERVGAVDLGELEAALDELNQERLPAIEDTLSDKADSSELGALDQTLREAFTEADNEVRDTVEGLPKVLRGTSAPSEDAPDGSTWFQHDGSLAGDVIAQWARVDGEWVSTPINSDAIANLDVGKLTAGGAVISDAVIQDLTAENGVFDRLDAREGWIGGVALEDGAVTARTIDVEGVFADEVVANTLWVDQLRARAAELTSLVVAAGNMVPNGDLTQGDSFWRLDGAEIVTDDTPPGYEHAIKREPGDGAVRNEAPFPVIGGEEYLFEMWIKADKPDSSFYWDMRDQNGDHVGTNGGDTENLEPEWYSHSSRWRPVSDLTVPTEWTRVRTILRPGEHVTSLYLAGTYFNHINGTEREATVWIAGVRVVPRAGAEVLVDGSVNTRHLVAEAVKAAQLDVQEIFADEAVIDTIWSDVVRARLLAAEEAIIGGALIKDNTIDVEHLNVTEALTAAVAQFLEVTADMITANAITSEKISTDAIQARHIAAKAIESDMIEAGAIRTEHVDAKSFVLSDSDSYTRTSISAEGLEVIESWQGYPDPTLQDPDLLAARYTVVDDWHNYELTDAKGTTLFPDTRRFSVRFRITVHSMKGLEVRALTREVPEAGIAYWTNSWDDIIDSPGDYFLGVGASDVYPYFGWVALKGDVTLHEMWFEPRENVNDLPILSVTKDGLKAWDSSGSETASIGSGGQNFLAGRLFTNSPGQPGVLLNEDYGPGSGQGAGVWLTDDGTAGSDQAAIWASKDRDTGKYEAMNIRGPKDGEVVHRSVSRFNSNEHGSPPTAMYVDGWIRNGGHWETSATANVYMNSGWGTLGRISSRRAIKVNIRPAGNDPANVLKLDPKSWVDLGELRQEFMERGLDPDDYISPDEGEGPTMDEAEVAEVLGELPKRTIGLVAEDVVEAGLMEYADWTRDEETGQYRATGVAYDRLWITLVPVVREHRDKLAEQEEVITELREENDQLRTKVDDMEARLAKLEASLNE